MGRKTGAVKAVQYLVDKKINIAAIVGDKNDSVSYKLKNIAKEYRIPFSFDEVFLVIMTEAYEPDWSKDYIKNKLLRIKRKL